MNVQESRQASLSVIVKSFQLTENHWMKSFVSTLILPFLCCNTLHVPFVCFHSTSMKPPSSLPVNVWRDIFLRTPSRTSHSPVHTKSSALQLGQAALRSVDYCLTLRAKESSKRDIVPSPSLTNANSKTKALAEPQPTLSTLLDFRFSAVIQRLQRPALSVNVLLS